MGDIFWISMIVAVGAVLLAWDVARYTDEMRVQSREELARIRSLDAIRRQVESLERRATSIEATCPSRASLRRRQDWSPRDRREGR